MSAATLERPRLASSPPGTLCIRREARTPLVVRPMQAVIASPRRAPRSDSAAHAFLLPQTCFTRRLTADAGGAKGAGGRSEPANRAVSLRRYLNCGTSDATPTQTGRSVGVRGRGAAGHPCTPLPRRLRRCGTARCVSGHGRDGGLELFSVSLRSSSSEADLELPAEALLHCLDGATLLLGEATQRDTANPLADARPRDGAQIGCGGDGDSDTGTLHPCHF